MRKFENQIPPLVRDRTVAKAGSSGAAPSASSVALMAVWFLAAGCSGGSGRVGDTCGEHADCADTLQCVGDVCVHRCARATDCGDGFSCTEAGLCVQATGQLGDRCSSETECEGGLACRLDATDADGDGRLEAICRSELPGHPSAASCDRDADCRVGLCALGICSSVCANTLDCAVGQRCAVLPRVEVDGAPLFSGCVPSVGVHRWRVPVSTPRAALTLPVPTGTVSLAAMMSVEDASQLVGAVEIREPPPSGRVLFSSGAPDPTLFPVRHSAAPLSSSVMLPPSPDVPVVPGAYQLTVSSLRANGNQGSAIPHVEVLAKMDEGIDLDIHFSFLNLVDHPCRNAFTYPPSPGVLDARTAELWGDFQSAYVGQLRAVFARSGIAIGRVTYADIANRPDLDGLDARNLRTLLQLPAASGGVHVIFARSIRPTGLVALHGGSPGDPQAGTTSSGGVVISADLMCYRTLRQVARITAHAIARHMGLPRNREPNGQRDPIADSPDTDDNLLHFSELGGTELSLGQRELLRRSVVLR